MKILWRIAVNTLIGLFLIWIWLKFVNLGEIGQILSKIELQYLGLIFLMMFLSPAIRAVRLKFFLKPVKNLPIKDLIFLNGFATLLNFVIPLRAGEIAKGVYLQQNYDLPLGKAVIWIFLDRFIDFLVILFLISIFSFKIITNLPDNFIFISSLLFIGTLTLTYLFIYKSGFLRKIFQFLSYLLIVGIIKIYFERFLNFLIETFTLLKRKPGEMLLFIFLSVLAYGVDGAIWYYSFLSLGSLQNFGQMYFGQLLSALTYLIPAAPMYVGSAEASGLLILSGILGIKPSLASAMIILLHLLTAVFVIIFGLVSLYLLKLDLGLILKKALKRTEI
ncbi:MAG: flippase-like domain-containing protein [Candidatus Daviesbacteria bacterium]|nr:MAG: flippase-like domain-containing protein [Candidatus Daviesbacteria bacterium]